MSLIGCDPRYNVYCDGRREWFGHCDFSVVLNLFMWGGNLSLRGTGSGDGVEWGIWDLLLSLLRPTARRVFGVGNGFLQEWLTQDGSSGRRFSGLGRESGEEFGLCVQTCHGQSVIF